MKLVWKAAENLKTGDLLLCNSQKKIVQLRKVKVGSNDDGSGFADLIYREIGEPWVYPAEESSLIVELPHRFLVYSAESRQRVRLSDLSPGDVIHWFPEATAVVEVVAESGSASAICACSISGSRFHLQNNCYVDRIIRFDKPPESLRQVKDIKRGDRIAFPVFNWLGDNHTISQGLVTGVGESVFRGEVIIQFAEEKRHFTHLESYVELLDSTSDLGLPPKAIPELSKGHLQTEMWF